MMGKRILVVDDDKFVRESFGMALEDMPYHLDTAESGESGIEKIASWKYDLVFLDLKMPGMNGVKTLRNLRKIDEKVPVYIVTAFHREFLRQLRAAEEEGLDFEIVNKPLRCEVINLIVESVLSGPQVLSTGQGAGND